MKNTLKVLPFVFLATACSSNSQTRPDRQIEQNVKEASAITQADVERIERTLAHDSMEGRRVGTPGAARAAEFIAAEMKRIGLKPGGDNGTYFQNVAGATQYAYGPSTMTVDGTALRWSADFIAAPTAIAPRTIANVPVVFGGVMNDSVNTITAEEANGKFVVVLPGRPGAGRAGGGRAGGGPPVNKFAGAIAVATINLDTLSPASIQAIATPIAAVAPRALALGAPPFPAPPPVPMQIRITSGAAAKLLGGTPAADAKAGRAGGRVTANFDYRATPRPTWTRNVIGIMPGGDKQMKDQWILIDAHYDHLGRLYGVTGDSVFNGADDDASGTTAVLEIARAMKAGRKPRRSVIFAAMTGEEGGLIGTNYYIARPYVPMHKVVANMEIEMIGRPDSLSDGRGGAWLTGYERSTMGEMLKAAGIRIFPDKRPTQRFFTRSDNIGFACMGIPAHTLSTFNLHKDYHQLSDDVNTIDFVHMTEVVRSGAHAARILADGPAPQWVEGGSPVGTPTCGGR